MIKINTSKIKTNESLKINSFDFDEENIPKNIPKFDGASATCNLKNFDVNKDTDKNVLRSRIGDIFDIQLKEKSNVDYSIILAEKSDEKVNIEFNFDEKNKELVSNIDILVKDEACQTIYITLNSKEDIKYYSNISLRLVASKNSNVKVVILNFLNYKSINLLSIDNDIKENANVRYILVDFGAKNNICNYFSNQDSYKSKNELYIMYIGTDKQFLDYNINCDLKGVCSNSLIDAKGALTDGAVKHFKSIIDFKKGAINSYRK